MDGERSSPGVGPRTWVTLGLLLLSWLVVVGLITRAAILWPAGWADIVRRIWISLLILVPHLFWVIVAWRGQRARPFARMALAFAMIHALLALHLALLVLGRHLGLEYGVVLRAVGWPSLTPFPSTYYVWGTSGVIGLATAVLMWRMARRKPTSDAAS